ncbi:hypothetical protein FOL47_002078, partial [Perkinsus chesapeaki]
VAETTGGGVSFRDVYAHLTTCMGMSTPAVSPCTATTLCVWRVIGQPRDRDCDRVLVDAEVKKAREMFVSEALKCLKLVPIDLVVPLATVLDAVYTFAYTEFRVREGAEVVVKMPNKGREVSSLDEWLLECVDGGRPSAWLSNPIAMWLWNTPLGSLILPREWVLHRPYPMNVKRLMESRSLDRARAFEVYMRECTDSELMAQTYARRSDGAGLTPGVCKYTPSNCPFNPCKYRLHSEEVSQGKPGTGYGCGKPGKGSVEGEAPKRAKLQKERQDGSGAPWVVQWDTVDFPGEHWEAVSEVVAILKDSCQEFGEGNQEELETELAKGWEALEGVAEEAAVKVAGVLDRSGTCVAAGVEPHQLLDGACPPSKLRWALMKVLAVATSDFPRARDVSTIEGWGSDYFDVGKLEGDCNQTQLKDIMFWFTGLMG